MKNSNGTYSLPCVESRDSHDSRDLLKWRETVKGMSNVIYQSKTGRYPLSLSCNEIQSFCNVMLVHLFRLLDSLLNNFSICLFPYLTVYLIKHGSCTYIAGLARFPNNRDTVELG